MLQLLDAEVKPFEDAFLKGLCWGRRDLILQKVEVDNFLRDVFCWGDRLVFENDGSEMINVVLLLDIRAHLLSFFCSAAHFRIDVLF